MTPLATKQCLTKNSNTLSLTPFLDSRGFLRVGDRLKSTRLPVNVKNPILLCSKHHLTIIIFTHIHKNLLHPERQFLLYNVRERYWPVGGETLSKKIDSNCVTCFKHERIPYNIPMEILPDEKVIQSIPFQNKGIDYTGPFVMQNKKDQGCETIKCYTYQFVLLQKKFFSSSQLI